MSIADLFGSVAPQYTMYEADKAKSADYESQIKAYDDAFNQYTKDYDTYKTGAESYNDLVKNYNDKLTAYQTDANAYNTALDLYKKEAQTYNDSLAAYKKKFDDYNAAVNKFNEGDRLTEFVDTDYYVAAPGEFTAKRPDDFTMVRPGEFEVTKPEFTLTEPTAPSDPGFDQAEIDSFIEASQGRARRRGAANAAALNVLGQGGNFSAGAGVQGGAGVSTQPEFSFSATGFADGGAVVPPPEGPPVVAPARNEGALGLGYYVPPGLREFGENVKAFAGAIDPVQGIMRGMRATGRAFDSELSPEERKAATIEAVLETLAPVGMIGMGALAKQPIKATLMDVLTPTGAPASMTDEAVEAVSDPSRRAFMKGAAATGGIAAILPDLAMEAMNRVPAAVTKTAAKAAGMNPINNAAENILILRKRIDDADELRDEVLDQVGDGVEAQSLQRDIFSDKADIEDVVRDTLSEMTPETYRGASDDALEKVAEFNYDVENFDIDIMQFKGLAEEAKRRGLHNVKNKEGITQFPNLSSLVDEIEFEITERAFKLENLSPSITNVKPIKLEMTDDSGKSTEQLVKELTEGAFKSQYEFVKKQLEETTDLSPEQIDRMARINAGRSGRNMAEGGVVSFAPYLR